MYKWTAYTIEIMANCYICKRQCYPSLIYSVNRNKWYTEWIVVTFLPWCIEFFPHSSVLCRLPAVCYRLLFHGEWKWIYRNSLGPHHMWLGENLAASSKWSICPLAVIAPRLCFSLCAWRLTLAGGSINLIVRMISPVYFNEHKKAELVL